LQEEHDAARFRRFGISGSQVEEVGVLGVQVCVQMPEIVGDSTIGDKDCCARQKHMGINKQYMRTKLAAQTEEKPSRRELDDLKASGIFEEEEDGHELDCLYADLEEAEAAPASASSASRG
jgi:hypothetical protein